VGVKLGRTHIERGSKLRVFHNRVLNKIFGPKRDVVTGIGENYIMRSLMICTAHQIYSGDEIEKRWAGRVACMEDSRGLSRALVGKPVGEGGQIDKFAV
jgi:hypothetical protein